MNFSETIAASDLKMGRSRLLIELMMEYEYSKSRLYLDLGPMSVIYEN